MLVPDGFPGQRMLVVPRPRLREHLAQPGRVGFLVTDCGYFPEAHSHGRSRARPISQCVVITCVSGRGWCETDAGRFEVVAGQVVVLEPDRPHSYGADLDEPWTVWWVHVAGAGLVDFLHDARLGNDQPVHTVSDLYPIVTLIAEIVGELERDDTSASLIAAAGAATHLMCILATDRGVGQGTEALVEHAATYLREHLREQISVAELARMSRLSTSHFAAVFRRRIGYSVLQYLTMLRMARARQLLDTSSEPISNVSAMVGYPDAFYFSRQFKRVHGITPREYRSGLRG
jgi:AraC-like DNA-binding protein